MHGATDSAGPDLGDRAAVGGLRPPVAGACDGPALMLRLEPGTDAPRRARDAVAEFLRDAALLAPDRIAQARIVVSELVTNSVLHADHGPIRLRAAVVSTGVRIEVRDAGPGLAAEVPPMPGPDGRGGRGLPLVGLLADRWGHERGAPAGVWFEMDAAALA